MIDAEVVKNDYHVILIFRNVLVKGKQVAEVLNGFNKLSRPINYFD